MSAPGTVDVAMLARLLNLTPRRIQQLAAEGVIPKDERGSYLLIPSVQNYVKYLQEKVSGGTGVEGLTTERARLAKEQADRLEMQNRITRREMAPVALIEEVIAKAASEVAGIFDSIPGGVRRRCPELPAEQINWIEEEITRARNRAAAMRLEDLRVELEAEEDEPA